MASGNESAHTFPDKMNDMENVEPPKKRSRNCDPNIHATYVGKRCSQ